MTWALDDERGVATAICNERGCDTVIGRCVEFLCGDVLHDDSGCGRYFCYRHLWLSPLTIVPLCAACLADLEVERE